MNWNLRLNPDKCQCILFRQNKSNYGRTQSKRIQEFNITAIRPDTGQREAVPRERVVKYLGVYIDEMLRMFDHTRKQEESFWLKKKYL